MNNEKKVSDYMATFLGRPESEIDKDYYKIEEMYIKRFGHGVPRAMLPDAISLDEIKRAMKTCLESGEDKLMELLGVEINNEYLY